jgi:hypothetical protein
VHFVSVFGDILVEIGDSFGALAQARMWSGHEEAPAQGHLEGVWGTTA